MQPIAGPLLLLLPPPLVWSNFSIFGIGLAIAGSSLIFEIRVLLAELQLGRERVKFIERYNWKGSQGSSSKIPAMQESNTVNHSCLPTFCDPDIDFKKNPTPFPLLLVRLFKETIF